MIALYNDNFFYFENFLEKDFTLILDNFFHDTNITKPLYFLKRIFEKANKIRNYKIFKYISEFIYNIKIYSSEFDFFSLCNDETIKEYLLEKYHTSNEKQFYSEYDSKLIQNLFTRNILNSKYIFEKYLNANDYFSFQILSDIYKNNTFIQKSDELYSILLEYFKNNISKDKYFIKYIIKNVTTNPSIYTYKYIILKEADLIELVKLSIVENHIFFSLPDKYKSSDVIVKSYLDWVGVEESIYCKILNSHFEEFQNLIDVQKLLFMEDHKLRPEVNIYSPHFTKDEHNKRKKELC